MAPYREKSNRHDPWYAKVAFGLFLVLRLRLQMMDDCGRHGLLGPQQGN
jgi:hypothetical protein